jgi:NAD(P)H-dependent flavin oxidoreductase YrpB (nitropropane dioxygenase family)
MWRSRFTQAYRLDVPFVSAGMGFLALPNLVAAVSNAGGLGLLGVAPAPAALMQVMIQQTKALTARSFGIDLIVEDTAFGPCTTVEHIEVCLAEQVHVVTFFWHPLPVDWVARLQAAGVKVWMTVGSVQGAREAVNARMDAVIAQGSEAGGHNKSTLALSSLVPAVVDAVAPLPVVAAGGIADGRGVAAALALGAEAVCVGTRLVASREAFVHDEYKRRVVAATVDDIARTSIFGPEWPDQPMKVIRNRVVREWAGRGGKTPPPPEPRASIGRTVLFSQEYPMPKFSAVLPTPHTTGDFEEMCLAAGESAGLAKDIKPAGDIVREMMDEAKRIVEARLVPLVGGG